jgi:hypothetical protein
MFTNPALILKPRDGFPVKLVVFTGSAQVNEAGAGWAAELAFVAGKVSPLCRDDIQ